MVSSDEPSIRSCHHVGHGLVGSSDETPIGGVSNESSAVGVIG